MFQILVIVEVFGSIFCGALTNASYVANHFDAQKLYPVAARTVRTVLSKKDPPNEGLANFSFKALDTGGF